MSDIGSSQVQEKEDNMRVFPRTTLCLMAVSVLATPAFADWDEGQPAKWVQYPDLSQRGIDVNASYDLLLADDFECSQTGPITAIHIWTSWLDDVLPDDDPRRVMFTLSIHKDIPADESPTGYSMPGEVLWWSEFQPGSFHVRIWEDGLEEGWLNPPEDYIFPGDTICWQYNFFIDESEAFVQEGTPDEPVVYWLDMKATPLNDQARLGWKTSADHWNDDAVWTIGDEPYGDLWEELRYPPGHPQHPESIDLAFVIGDEPDDTMDFGDAPDPTYPTLLANNGGRHVIVAGMMLGTSIDGEPDGQPHPIALGDDNNGPDEDGVVFTSPIEVGGTASVDVTASMAGRLDAWLDFAGDGSWAGDVIFSSVALSPGANPLNFTVPASAVPGSTFVRFRYSSTGGLNPFGLANDGEIEDYLVIIIDPPADELDFGDAPDPTYPTLLTSNGARHVIDSTVLLGSAIDAEADGLPSGGAMGDDTNNIDDEDGVILTSPLLRGAAAGVTVTSTAAACLDAWIDFNADGAWAGATEHILVSEPLSVGNNPLTFNVPMGSANGPTYARFRLSTTGGLSPDGLASDGEVEDYKVYIRNPIEESKWLQSPDLRRTGIDVNVSNEYLLADDFLCTETERITEVDIWASWLGDWIPYGESPYDVTFMLSFHADISADESPTGYSMPGEVLWWRLFQPGEFSAAIWAHPVEEGWMNPPEEYYFPADWTCWRYHFDIDPVEAFLQVGTQDSAVVYWLDVKAVPGDPQAFLGWKTSTDHWNDDAVWTFGEEPYEDLWEELRYPPDHPNHPESIDLAFRLFGVPVDAVPEGDGPQSYLLQRNAPNPFRSITTIRFDLPADDHATIRVYSVDGQEIATLLDERKRAGQHVLAWDGRDNNGHSVPSGVYFCELAAGSYRQTYRMVLTR